MGIAHNTLFKILSDGSTYTYDANGSMLSRTRNGVTTQFVGEYYEVAPTFMPRPSALHPLYNLVCFPLIPKPEVRLFIAFALHYFHAYCDIAAGRTRDAPAVEETDPAG